MDNPKVSILIPAYKPDYFELTLKSAQDQLYRPLEIIVSDDCPDEDIRRICERHPDVQYYRNTDEPFFGNVRNLLSRASGKIIKILCDDDLLDPFCVARMSEVLVKYPDVKVVSSSRWLIDENGQQIKQSGLTIEQNTIINGIDAIVLAATKCSNYIGEWTTYAFRRADYEAAGGDFTRFGDAQLLGLTDLILALTLLRTGKLFYFQSPLSSFRQHSKQTTQIIKPRSIRIFTGWQDLIEEAYKLKYLNQQQYHEACIKLIETYEFVRKRGLFPELDQRIKELKSQHGDNATTVEN